MSVKPTEPDRTRSVLTEDDALYLARMVLAQAQLDLRRNPVPRMKKLRFKVQHFKNSDSFLIMVDTAFIALTIIFGIAGVAGGCMLARGLA